MNRVLKLLVLGFLANSLGALTSKAVPYDQYIQQKTEPTSSSPQAQDEQMPPQKAQVQEVIQSGGYTFLRLKMADTEAWAAVIETPIKKDAIVSFTKPLVMEGFHSKSLDRTFERILFISQLTLVDP